MNAIVYTLSLIHIFSDAGHYNKINLRRRRERRNTMAVIVVDAVGEACPIPVVKAPSALRLSLIHHSCV